jgi:hypothetical protein
LWNFQLFCIIFILFLFYFYFILFCFIILFLEIPERGSPLVSLKVIVSPRQFQSQVLSSSIFFSRNFVCCFIFLIIHPRRVVLLFADKRLQQACSCYFVLQTYNIAYTIVSNPHNCFSYHFQKMCVFFFNVFLVLMHILW